MSWPICQALCGGDDPDALRSAIADGTEI